MPRYFLIDRAFLKASNEASARNHEPGDTIEFDGTPGTVMLALDQAAHDAKIAGRTRYGRVQPPTNQQRIDEAQGRRRLNGSQRKMLAEAEAQIVKAE